MPDASAHLYALPEAAGYLRISEEAVGALVGAGYLLPAEEGPEGPRFPVVDLKAFLARNADGGSGNLFDLEPGGGVDPQALLEALDTRAEEMARRAFEIFAAAFPEATGWSLRAQARFIDQARARFEAILAVTSQGVAVDEALVDDLQEVGAGAAMSGSSLPQLLVILRISRDLVVQTAVELAEERGKHWGLALSLLLTRILPAMDRLTDALAQGYWASIVAREEELRLRYEHVVEHASDGVYEIDLDGFIRYANPALAIILGRELADLEGKALLDVLVGAPPAEVERLLQEPLGGTQRFELHVVRTDGVDRLLDVRTQARLMDGAVAGFEGVVRDVTAVHHLERERREFLELVTGDLRQPLNTILGLSATVETHAQQLPPDRIQAMARSVRHQAERISRLADDLHDLAQLEAQELQISARPVDLAQVVSATLESVGGSDWVQPRVPHGLTVHADARRLEQTVANLVEFVISKGEPPVTIEAYPEGNAVRVDIAEAGGLDPADVNRWLEARIVGRERSGLSLAARLAEAMGGRVWLDVDAGRPVFHLTVPVPRRRAPEPR